MQQKIIIPDMAKRSRANQKPEPMKFTYIKPAILDGLTPKIGIKSGLSLRKKQMQRNIPEIVALTARKRDLISPYSLRTRDFIKISKSCREIDSKSPDLPTFPISYNNPKDLRSPVTHYYLKKSSNPQRKKLFKAFYEQKIE
jgi:hypothetical protein